MNENWDSDVRADMSDSLDRIVVEDKGSLCTMVSVRSPWRDAPGGREVAMSGL